MNVRPRIEPLLRLVLLIVALPALSASGTEEPVASPVFIDVTRQAGVDFRHVHGGGSNPRRYYVETMGSGAAFVDYDQDGWLDSTS